MDPEKRRALSDFYREEFLRHIELLESNGIVHAGNRESVGRVYRTLFSDLEDVCWRSGFPAMAETLLERFDTLTRLSEVAPRQGH